MGHTRNRSLANLTRRNLLLLPGFCWATSLFAKNPLAKAVLNGTGSSNAAATPPRPSRSLSLNGTWSLTYGPCPEAPKKLPQTSAPADWPTIPATVPGNVELDLVAAGRMEPLEKGNRVYQALKLESHQWWYRRSFKAGATEPGERAELVFEGLDCLGTVWLNGKLIGQSANMLIAHRFDVSPFLLANAENEVVVRIDPAVPAGRAVSYSAREYINSDSMESLHVRKAPHMYGWDIMPRIVSAGLWRDVRLEWTRPVRLADVYWHTRAADTARKAATVAAQWKLIGADAGRYRVEVVIERNGHRVFHSDAVAQPPHGHLDCVLNNIDLWWPRGFGEQPLYDGVITLRNTAGAIVDRRVTRVGIRTIELDRTDILTADGKGKFGFVVNGEPVFIKGADYSCLDALHSRDSIHLEAAVGMLRELNCNMVRCWGGNVYPEDRFFDLCDESGILVWQDFAMACAVYPQNESFLRAIETEARAVVPRLRNHASLALWCGNNECDDAYESAHTQGKPPIDPNGDRLTRQVIPDVLKELDPHRSYLPSSPYHSPAVFAAGNKIDTMPEVHLWGPRSYFKNPFYTSSPAHFVSEIGYHGCPSRASLERMLDAAYVEPWVKDRVWNDEWLTKSVRATPTSKNTAGRNDLMINQIKALFGTVPEDLDNFILASQITQAEAMKFFVELFRQQKGIKEGIIWWNIRDGWPIVSDAVVDYYNTRKLAFYYLQRAQRDVQAICCEIVEGQHQIVVVNDTLKKVRGHIEIARAGGAGAKLLETSFEVGPNGKSTVGSLAHPEQAEMWRLDWRVEAVGEFTSHYLAVSGVVSYEQYKEWRKVPGLLPS
ncbi:MAG: glycoside hydrolase family 2 TIM barrel-domain containing protein [Formivibrio sp.]|nr:glycoside hydrolase family 2 TIM barrel-domain containing protein [Formivibrio sp.]